jgi:CBS domain-containing protein
MRVLEIIEAKRNSKRTQLLRPHDSIEFAANYLVTNDVGAVVVCDDVDGVMGLLSERDILKGLVRYGPAVMTRQAHELMQPLMMYCSPEDTLAHAVITMNHEGIRHLPVMEATRVIGIVSMRDLLAHMSVQEQRSH